MVLLKVVFILFTSLLLSANSLAAEVYTTDLKNAPPAIKLQDVDKKIVPVDIVRSVVDWSVKNSQNLINVEAKLRFNVGEEGFPFLLLNPSSRAYNAKGDELPVIKIGKLNGNYYYLAENFLPGATHEVVLKYSFEPDFSKQKNTLPVHYSRGKYIEMGIPANGMYDHFKVSLFIEMDKKDSYKIFTNGKVFHEKRSKNIYQIEFPETFTSISHYIDIVPTTSLMDGPSKFLVNSTSVESVDGRSIQIIAYSKNNDSAKNSVGAFLSSVQSLLSGLESRFGPYPYEKIIINVSNKEIGEGAYAGVLSLRGFYIEHLSHELSHHWFLQSVSPKNGADTWLYEGFGFWVPYMPIMSGVVIDEKLKGSISYGSGKYALWSSPEIFPQALLQVPHQLGARVLGAIDKYIKENGKTPDSKKGLDFIFKKIFSEKANQTVSTSDFQMLLEKHTKLSFSKIFLHYFVAEAQ